MEGIIASLFEKSVVYGAFVLLLYHVLQKQDKQLTEFSKALKESNKTMKEISETLVGFEHRLDRIERKEADR